MRLIAGMENDCICAKPRGKHNRYCDDYRLSLFMVKASGLALEEKLAPTEESGEREGV